ncbi:MAG: hypothetical protein GY841_22125 [FCB group bacterium]|nr:hypothetical protein [FCB group bacterium]
MLFDKFDIPMLSGLDDDSDWDTCEDFENRVYDMISNENICSDSRAEQLLVEVRDLYNDYYALYES